MDALHETVLQDILSCSQKPSFLIESKPLHSTF